VPAGHVAQVEPLRNAPVTHDAVPAKVAPPDKRAHDDETVEDDTAPSAKQRTSVVAMLLNATDGVNVYDVGVDESAPAGDTVAADHVGVPA